MGLRPEGARALPEALEAVEAADLIAIGPGSLYSSLVPNLLVPELRAAIARAGARVVVVLNLMTEPGETDGYAAADVVSAIQRHAPGVRIHDVIFNTTPIPEPVLARYAADGAAPIPVDVAAITALGCRSLGLDLLADSPVVRHDPDGLARALLALAAEAPA
jgi:uncharacterized cofD-like protein